MKTNVEGSIDRNLFPSPPKRRRSRGKMLSVLAVLIVGSMVASAGLLTYFGETKVTAHVEQSVIMNSEPEVEFDICAGCTECVEHTVTNNGCTGVWLDWEHFDNPGNPQPFDDEGVDIDMTEICDGGGDCCDHILEKVVVDVLDGQAMWDDFNVYVDGTFVGTYYANGDDETWLRHIFDLTDYQIPCCGAHTIKIECFYDDPWEMFNPYGQLAVDYVALYCEGNVLCDEVDIGNPTSEAGHNLQGWGPIEPANTGGVYGNIDDCRCTWFWTDGDILDPPATTADESWATLELTCEDCYSEEGCEECPVIETPFYLGPGEELNFYLRYNFDIAMEPGTYHIWSKLVPVEAPLE